MVESADIRNEESLKAWLNDQPQEVAVWIASRAAARALPVWWDAVLTEDWARERYLPALPVLRSLLISSVAAHVPTDDIRDAADAAQAAAAAASDENVVGVFAAVAAGAADTAAFAAADTARATNTARATRAAALAYADSAAKAVWRADYGYTSLGAYAADPAGWKAVHADADQTATGNIPNALPLWPEGRGPLEETWRAIKGRVDDSKKAEDWPFWTQWYDSLLDGRPMLGDAARTWEMLEQIALIDPETWDKGPEVVNPAIREIWQLYRLRDEVAALRAEKERLLAGRASPEARSHNRPPELVDAEPELARQVEIVWTGLDEAQEELEQEVPDKHRLQRIAESMLTALTAIAAYCGKVADAAVMSAARVGGGAVGTAILDQVANNGRLLRFAQELLAHAVGG